jgi:NitT/TauT family transport system permease protein
MANYSNLVGAGCGFGVAARWFMVWAGLNGRQSAYGSAGMKLSSLRDILAPAIFGIAVLILWQAAVRYFNVPFVIFPAPTDIWSKLIVSLPTLYEDFVQTFIRAVIRADR